MVYQNRRKKIIPTNTSIINMQHKMWQRRGATTTLAAALYGWRAEEDGFGISLHYFDEETQNHSWEAGQWYSIPTEGKHLTSLSMDIYLKDDEGNEIERSVDLLAVMRDNAQ